MGASAVSFIRFSSRAAQTSRVRSDFDRLIKRMRQRLYPETMQTLGFYWLKTVYAQAYDRAEWEQLDRLLAQPATREVERQTLADVREWIRGEGLLTKREPRKGAQARPSREGPAAGLKLDRETLRPYLARLLNEWLPIEVSRLLVDERDDTDFVDGIPAVAIARALERLLIRQRLSPATLEEMLQPGLLSPRSVYPGDAEILRDVVLFLLGRTDAPPVDVMPAVLLSVAPGAHLPDDYEDAVNRAFLSQGDHDELHVPIAPVEAMKILTSDQVRITSLIVTMDGRLWQAHRLKTGPQSIVVYRPAGPLAIDYSNDHARVKLPWSEARFEWAGTVNFEAPMNFFGREWRIAQWEQDAESTWLHLEFVRTLPIPTEAPNGDPILHRARPASVEMAWTALGNALAAAVASKNLQPVEDLRQHELIPLGRALYALIETVVSRSRRNSENIEPKLRAAIFHNGKIAASHGPVPWRILPQQVRNLLLDERLHRAIGPQLDQLFEGLPEADHEPSHAA